MVAGGLQASARARDMRKIVIPLLLLFFISSPAAAQRLSGTVIPEHYTLWFAPDLAKATFRGRETIRVQLKSPASSITLHAAEIEFVEATIEAAGTSQAARVTLDSNTETATLTVPRQMPAGAATIRISYNGILNNKQIGRASCRERVKKLEYGREINKKEGSDIKGHGKHNGDNDNDEI